MPLSGLQAMLSTDCDDTEILEELLRTSFPRLEAKVAEIATGDCEEDFGIILVSWDLHKRSVEAALTEMGREAALTSAARAAQSRNNSAVDSVDKGYGQSGYVQKPYDIRPIDGDPLRAFPEFAVLRDKWGLRMTSFADYKWSWVARLEGESFDLVIGKGDRGDDEFCIRPKGSGRDWYIPEVLREMGLWSNLRERVDHRKLARVLEQNLPAILMHIMEKENPSGSA